MHAEPLTQHRDGPDKGIRSLVYDIVLEEDVLGVPVSALPIVITAVAAVIVRFSFFCFSLQCFQWYSRLFLCSLDVCDCVAVVGWGRRSENCRLVAWWWQWRWETKEQNSVLWAKRNSCVKYMCVENNLMRMISRILQ